MASMKILIAYDGSVSADEMINDLPLAGLPAEIEACVLSVAELSFPPASIYGITNYELVPELPINVDEARTCAARAVSHLQKIFPRWQLSAEARVGSPAQEIIHKADKWQPDLIVVGAQGQSALARVIFGSVSQRVVTEAHHCVRVSRPRIPAHSPAQPIKILIGADNSIEANAAIHAVAARKWPAGSEVLLVTALGQPAQLPVQVQAVSAGGGNLTSTSYVEGVKQALEMALTAELKLAGLKVSYLAETGDAKRLLVDEAARWGADSIFVGSRSFGRIKRLLLGSVSTAVVTRAHCSVEVVRVAAH